MLFYILIVFFLDFFLEDVKWVLNFFFFSFLWFDWGYGVQEVPVLNPEYITDFLKCVFLMSHQADKAKVIK